MIKEVIECKSRYIWNEDHTHAFYRLLDFPELPSKYYPGITHNDFDGYWSEFTAKYFRVLDGKHVRITIEVLED